MKKFLNGFFTTAGILTGLLTTLLVAQRIEEITYKGEK